MKFNIGLDRQSPYNSELWSLSVRYGAEVAMDPEQAERTEYRCFFAAGFGCIKRCVSRPDRDLNLPPPNNLGTKSALLVFT